MIGQFQFSRIWQGMSTELLDTALRFEPFRKWALSQGRRQLYRQYVTENQAHLPNRVQEMRCKVLTNLLYSVNRAFTDGRISPGVRRSIIKDFIGSLVIGEEQRTQSFREEYGFNPPTFLTISPTKNCNLRCKGCYAASSSSSQNTLSFSVFNRILKEKRDAWGSHFTVISGGEPLMYRSEGRDIFDVLADNRDQYFMMYTNSTLIDEETAGKMAEAGNITPAISVEGWEDDTDERRGKGVFTKIQRAMEHLKKAGVPFGISVTATRQNAETVLSDAFLDYYFENMGAIYGWIFQYMPIGRSYTIDMMVSPEQRRWMLEKELEMIWDKNRFLVDFWNGGIMSVGCISAGKPGGYFYIDWDGNIAPCVFFPYKAGNVYELFESGGSLNSILAGDYFQAIRSWQDDYVQKNGEVKNLFLPCPIRDHYDFAYQTITGHHVAPMDDDAARALTDPEYRHRMVEYGNQVRELLDPLWKREVYPESTIRENLSG